MTRIIAGRAGGRPLATPKGSATRPTTDRVREAMFSRLDSLVDFAHSRVLDLYAGSGALGLEAASRGAPEVVCVESDKPTARLIQRNAMALDLEHVIVRGERVERLLRQGPGASAYDLVLADPPYPLDEDAISTVLTLLVTQEWLRPDAVVMLERSSRSPLPKWPGGLEPLRSKAYGETTVHDALCRPD
ncbi:MAG: 16S rRNA (guanine(966)-N(2))-methyltransferase RsmD [Ornithinimicrobium sp.]